MQENAAYSHRKLWQTTQLEQPRSPSLHKLHAMGWNKGSPRSSSSSCCRICADFAAIPGYSAAWQLFALAVTKSLANTLFLWDFRDQAGAGPPPDPAANPFLGDDYHKYKQQQIL